MKRRIFIAINFPEKIKKELVSFQEEIDGVFGEKKDIIRWTKTENLHITLVFLGDLADQELLEVCKITKEATQKHKPFSINLNRICYGPPKKMPPRPPKFSETVIVEESKAKSLEKFWRPRMVWVDGEKSAEFTALRDDLEKALMVSEGVKFSPEERVFSPHITLGRIKTWQWRQIDPEEKPEVNEEISLGFPVDSIEAMESRLKRTGPEYTILESFPLRQDV